MASGNKKKFSCGHRGFGDDHCHRCDFAGKLEKMAKDGKRLVDHKKHKKPHTWTLEEMLSEAKRLRAIDRR